MSTRTITVTLTEPQFNALSSVVGRGLYEIECEMEDEGMAYARHDHRMCSRAWDKLADAWYAKDRRSSKAAG